MREQQYAAPPTGRSEEAGPARRRVGRSTRLAAAAAAGLAALVLTGCGEEGADASAPKKVAGEAAPAPGDAQGDTGRKESSSPSSPSGSGGDSSERDKAEGGEKPPASSGDDEAGGSSGGEGGAGGGAPDVSSCKTSGLGFSTSNGSGEGTLQVNLKNTGSATCTLKGFPGVDINGEGGALNAERSNAAAPAVSLPPGETTHFTLNYPPNDSGGSGANFTSLTVTPPNETQSRTLPASINLPVSDSPSSGITVSPVGAGG